MLCTAIWCNAPGQAGPGNSVFMSLLRQSLVWIVCSAAACAQARANDLSAAQPQPSRTAPAKANSAKLHKVTPSRTDELDGVKFSHPYAPPVGAGKAAGGDFPAVQRAAPIAPKGDVSFTYKWHATNDPVDPYNAVTHKEGPRRPGRHLHGRTEARLLKRNRNDGMGGDVSG
jgi:hypothetical protein